MTLGEKIEQAISESGESYEAVAAYTGISVATLRRLTKKDSADTADLIKISEILKKPLGYFLSELVSNSGQQQIANQVKKNRQQISVGGENLDELRHQLELCQVERESLTKQLADKEQIIELLRSK
ncbi:helix-turn-helix domain-containing protein [Rufibacter roseus]|uniref:Helix-turn-helix domain-containing protein n=1 Tax=Rufibacter roseus TaxID=1567108 RepID=A0ABW2DP07_9BACT|nr:helix-turn-helix domain-containing protein [Rufibacter roseus]